jgi:hypothetical protein
MIPRKVQVGVMLAAALFVPTASAQTPIIGGGLVTPAEAKRQRQLKREQICEMAKKLEAPVTFTGADDPKTTLCNVLDDLATTHNIGFTVNERAFEAEGLKNVLTTTVVADGKPLPRLKNVSLNTVLRKVLSRIPSTSGATFINRGDEIEITTMAAFKASVFLDPDRCNPFPLVRVEIAKQPLEEALRELAEESGFNIVLDAHAGEKVKAEVAGSFQSVPLDTAVRILADMADLKPVLLDNVLYVTTKENARALAEEDHRRNNAEQGKKLGDEKQAKAEEIKSQMQKLQAELEKLQAEIDKSKKK